MAFGKRGRDNDPPSRRIQRRGVDEQAAHPDAEGGFGALEDELYADERYSPPSGKRKKGGRRGHERAEYHQKRRRFRVRFILLGILALMLLAMLFLYGCVRMATKNDDLWLDLNNVQNRTGTVLYYTDQSTGQVLEYVTVESIYDREYVSWGDIPQDLKNAFVAIEDKNFYNHRGVDLKRTVYAMLNEAKYTFTGSYIGGDSGRKQGASTLDQQLIKNLTGDDDASGISGYYRKLVEIYRAYKLDRSYSKDEVLCAYLNVIGFTGNSEGVQAESRKLFGKPVSELTLAECASIASITRNPSRYNPVTNPETHLDRRNYVLGEMLEQGYITQAQHSEAVNEPLNLGPEAGINYYDEPVYDYFTETVFDNLRDELVAQRGITRTQASDLIYNGGLVVYTTVVPELQAAMQTTMENRSYFNYGGVQVQQQVTGDGGEAVYDTNGQPLYETVTIYPEAAMVSLDYEGGITAIVGGLGEKELRRPFNRATSAARQIGSTAKGIAPYVLALEENRITWSTAFRDSAVRQEENEQTGEMEDWPRNVTNYYTDSDMLLYNAFAQSVNTIAVRVGDLVGNRKMYSFLTNDVGITTLESDDRDSGPLVLGSNTVGITPLELAMAYSMLGNGGYIHTTHSFTHVENGAGAPILEMNVESRQVISGETAYIMNRLMRQVMVGSGTASGKSVAGSMDSVGKTGTTSDHRDNWFVGLTPYYVTAVWYGYDDNEAPLSVNNSQHPCILAWKQVMETAQTDLPYREFPTSSGVSEHAFCTVSGHAAGPNCPSAIGYYKNGEEPEENCPVHG